MSPNSHFFLQVVSEMTGLLPELITEMEKLRSLAPDLKKSKEEQKKAAGFIQQRKRADLNTLFMTLQSIGFSYRFGVTSCSDLHSYTELFTHPHPHPNPNPDPNPNPHPNPAPLTRTCTFLLPRALSPEVSSVLREQFQGFA